MPCYPTKSKKLQITLKCIETVCIVIIAAVASYFAWQSLVTPKPQRMEIHIQRVPAVPAVPIRPELEEPTVI